MLLSLFSIGLYWLNWCYRENPTGTFYKVSQSCSNGNLNIESAL